MKVSTGWRVASEDDGNSGEEPLTRTEPLHQTKRSDDESGVGVRGDGIGRIQDLPPG